jgi:hypothetical protein
MMRLLAFVFSATLFSFVLVQEASALRRGGIHVGGGGLRGFSGGAYRGGLRARNFSGYRAAAWGGRRSWRGARRWYGYGAGVAALAGAYSYNDPYYDDAYDSDSSYSPAYGYTGAYSGSYGYSSGTYGYSSAAAAEADAGGPGTCGTYHYWKDGRCVDARGK